MPALEPIAAVLRGSERGIGALDLLGVLALPRLDLTAQRLNVVGLGWSAKG